MTIDDLKGNYTVVGNKAVATPEQVEEQPKETFMNKVNDFFGGKGVAEAIGTQEARNEVLGNKTGAVQFDYSKLSPQATQRLKDKGVPTNQEDQNKEVAKSIQGPSAKEIIGSVAQLGANFIPGAGEGAGLLEKVAKGAATGYAFDVGHNLQDKDKNVGQSLIPGVGTVAGGTLPLAGALVNKVAAPIIGRLFKGLGSGLSGASSDMIQQIVDNPEAAQKVSRQISENGGDKVLEQNAKSILDGVSKIRKESSAAFGKGLEELKGTDINPTTFRQQTQDFFDRHNIYIGEDGSRNLAGVEFDDPKNLQKASDLIDRLQNAELDGASLRKLSDDIENAKYKTATSDERLSFNSFIADLSKTVKNAVVKSTDKLTDINAAYSSDRQLAESVQKIFGKVKFNNLPEVLQASQKLESLFNQKGLAPKVVDDFLTRIGINPEEFRAGEAVRQIGNKAETQNSVGTGVGEIMRNVTSAIVTPDMVKNAAIKTGMAKGAMKKALEVMSTPARNAFLQALESAS